MEFRPIILLKVDKKSKLSRYNVFLQFYLAINLRQKNSKKLLFDAKEVVKQ